MKPRQSLRKISTAILQSLIARRSNVASWMRNHPIKKWISTLSFLAPFGGALTAVQMDEYFVGAILLASSGLILVLWSWLWIGFEQHSSSTNVVKTAAAVGGIVIAIFFYPFVLSRKEERPWSKTWDYWTTLQTLRTEIATPLPPPLTVEPSVAETQSKPHPLLSPKLPTLQVPGVSIVTQEGLAPHDFRNLTISPEMTNELRRQVLTIQNPNSVELKNLVIRFQLPEPVFGEPQVESAPAGVAIEMDPCRMSLSLVGTDASMKPTPESGLQISTGSHAGDVAGVQGMGEVCSQAMHNPQMHLTGIYQLRVATLPSKESIKLVLLTTNGAAGRMYLETMTGDRSGGLSFYGDGSYQLESQGQVETRPLFVELVFDREKRKLNSLPASGERGKWKIRRHMMT